MSGVKDITPDLRKLEVQLDNLEEDLEPLLEDFETMSSQLPLLDKAKLYSLTAYAIESMLFSSLKLQGQDAQNHAVFTELKRIQQYFGKIKAAEEPGAEKEAETERRTTVNQEAAARVLKADLSDNKNISAKLAEKIAEERAKALLKSLESKKRPAEDSPGPEAPEADAPESKKSRKSKHKSRSKDRGKGKAKSKK